MSDSTYIQFEESWRMHSNINLFLIDNIQPEYWNDQSASKGKTVFAHFAHIHNVRISWMEHIAPELIAGIDKLSENYEPEGIALKKALQGSSDSISKLIFMSERTGGKIKAYKTHIFGFIGYLISHESHHRGQIMLCLKQSGHTLSKEIAYEIWSFNKFLNLESK